MAFIERLPSLWRDLPVTAVLWSFRHDVGDAQGPAFASVALRTRDGAAKPAFAAWQALAGVDQDTGP